MTGYMTRSRPLEVAVPSNGQGDPRRRSAAREERSGSQEPIDLADRIPALRGRPSQTTQQRPRARQRRIDNLVIFRMSPRYFLLVDRPRASSVCGGSR